MNVVIDLHEITKRNIQYHETTLNTVLDDSTFVRIGYSNTCFTTNGIYICTTFHVARVDKYFNKYKYVFDCGKNKELIDGLILLEKLILEQFDLPTVQRTYKLKEHLQTGVISIFDVHENCPLYQSSRLHTLTLKISGIWITSNTMGLTYKFLKNYPSVEK